MFEFKYYVRFFVESDYFYIRVFLHLSPYTIVVYKRAFPDTVRLNRNEFIHIYRELRPYLEGKQIVISKDDLRLLYTTFSQLTMPLPTVQKVIVSQVRETIDETTLNQITPKEILLLHLVDGKRYTSYFKDFIQESYLMDVDYSIMRLEKLDLLKTDDLTFSLSKLPVHEWNALLDKVQYDGERTSRVLVIEYLWQYVRRDFLVDMIGDMYIKLTDKGLDIVRETKHVLDFHNHSYRYQYQLSIDEFFVLSEIKKDYHASDVIKLLLVNQNKDKLDQFNWQTIFDQEFPPQTSNAISHQFVEIINRYQDHPKETVSKKEPTIRENKPINIDDTFFQILSNKTKKQQEATTKPQKKEKHSDENETEWDTFIELIQKNTPVSKKKKDVQVKSSKPSSSEQVAKETMRTNDHRPLERLKGDKETDDTSFNENLLGVCVFIINFALSTVISLVILSIWYLWVKQGGVP